jgi:hypothetical protein
MREATPFPSAEVALNNRRPSRRGSAKGEYGESTVETERRWLYEKAQWPIKSTEYVFLKELDHTAWAVADASKHSDLIHVQSTQALALSHFANRPFVLTLHGPHESKLSEYFSHYPEVQYVAISEDQAQHNGSRYFPRPYIWHRSCTGCLTIRAGSSALCLFLTS